MQRNPISMTGADEDQNPLVKSPYAEKKRKMLKMSEDPCGKNYYN